MSEQANAQPLTRSFRLFTEGKEPGIDAMAIIAELLKEMAPNERNAALGYFADLYGFKLRSW